MIVTLGSQVRKGSVPVLADLLDLFFDLQAASDAIQELLSGLSTERLRDAARYRAHIAAAQARTGDIDGAVEDAVQAAGLSMATGTTWTLNELRQLARRPDLALLGEALTDTTGQQNFSSS